MDQEASWEHGGTRGREETCGRTFDLLTALESGAAAAAVVVDQVTGSPEMWSWDLQLYREPRSCRTEVISGHWLQQGGGQVGVGAGLVWC